ncbi:nuclear transport factor 2 family protein [Mycobacterium sp. MYCO198283]|uniref:nuclear transport factor 2 family protein n=1 Tax=Mycobacterium sp. MYCO198283 TaxID=2883505 RepID=UPI001E38D51E|nr:nuclear transport factor 2 family protein [Mycobacterium sp. MYCO198283]MCG5433235.1 nuclear transport factor 2 family protein [Mycobacterium sp. MYCO198283]
MSAEDTVLGLWRALSDRDWDRLTTFLADDCIYADMPVGLTLAARGPADIVKRLKVGLEPLAHYENHDGVIVSNGVGGQERSDRANVIDVLYEHSETWRFDTGEQVVLPFVTVHKVRGDQVTVWKDYWDFGALANSAPPRWLENLGNADTSWVYDATGQV